MKQMIVRCIEMVEQHQQWKKVRTNITQGVEQEKVVAVATAITRRPAIGIVVGHRLCQGHIAGGTISMMMVRNRIILFPTFPRMTRMYEKTPFYFQNRTKRVAISVDSLFAAGNGLLT